jgi:hypothetical protein
MEQIPSWEANRSSASQEIHHILWNQKVQYHIHKHLPSVPVLSQINPVSALHPTSSRSVLMLFCHLSLSLGITSPFSIIYVMPNDHSNSEALWNGKFLWWGVLSTLPNPRLADHLLLAVRNCLFDIFAAAIHFWRPFLQPQPENTPCHGDRDPFIAGRFSIVNIFFPKTAPVLVIHVLGTVESGPIICSRYLFRISDVSAPSLTIPMWHMHLHVDSALSQIPFRYFINVYAHYLINTSACLLACVISTFAVSAACATR